MSFDGGVRKLKRSAGLILQVLRHASVAGQERIAANGSHLNVITVLQVPTDEAKVLLLPSEINVQLCRRLPLPLLISTSIPGGGAERTGA